MSNIIEFFCHENDKPVEIQLEPEALIFIASPENSVRFVAVDCDADFRWSLRIVHEKNSVQLCPDTVGEYDIKIYENGQLLDNWYKYMKPLD